MKAQSINFTQGGSPIKKLNIGQRREGIMFSKFNVVMQPKKTYEDLVNIMIDYINDIGTSMAMEYKGGDLDNDNFKQQMPISIRENFEEATILLDRIEIDLDNLFEILDNTQIPS